MKLQIKNIGKIGDSTIELNGLTVICGDNNTGKSTVGKSLFTIINSTVNFLDKIEKHRKRKFKDILRNRIHSKDISLPITIFSTIIDNIAEEMYDFIIKEEHLDLSKIESTLNKYDIISNKNEAAKLIHDIAVKSDEDILNEYIYRYANDVFSNQIKTTNKGKTISSIDVEIQGKTNKLKVLKSGVKYTQNQPISHPAYYISNPFLIDKLNAPFTMYFSELEKNVISAILDYEKNISEDKMNNIFEAVDNKEKFKDIDNLLKKAFCGNIKIDEGKYYYSDSDGNNFDLRNISAGLKSFAMIERVLSCGILKQSDFLILDEPEIHLHPEWQLIYAELIVAIQRTYNLTILITTHSPYFLRAIETYTAIYKTNNNCTYYLSQITDNVADIVNVTSNTNLIYEKLSEPLASLQYMRLTDE